MRVDTIGAVEIFGGLEELIYSPDDAESRVLTRHNLLRKDVVFRTT